MRSLLKTLFCLSLCSLISEGIAHVVELDKRNTTVLAAPIVAEPSEHWEGVDGTWSTFEIRVGTPPQYLRVLPVTSWQETWVIYGGAANICNASEGVSGNCQQARGDVFQSSQSSTWSPSAEYQLGLDSDLGMDGEGQYGFDTLGLGYTNTTGPTLTHQIISEIVSDTFWFGILGLGFQPTNFSGYADPQPSFADTLQSQGLISSRSWSYTAGAYYRLKGIFGSLIFGGMDKSRFVPNNITFTMTEDNLRDIVLTIQSITSTTSSGTKTLFNNATFAFIDSAVPELWLPVEACQAFESAFGITYDNSTELYLINSTTRSSLLSLNPNITFSFSDQKTTSPTPQEIVNITLPYASFDLNITAPLLPNSSSYYFPLRRATDESQYTLGRTFLQEAYVTADYNSRTFNVSECVFSANTSPNIVAIPSNLPTSSRPGSSSTSSSKPHHLSPGAIAGIVIGSIVVLVLIFLFIFLFIFLPFYRRRRRRNNHQYPSSSSATPHSATTHELSPNSESAMMEKKSGRSSSPPQEPFYTELQGRDAKVEAAGNPIMIAQELEGSPVMGRVSGIGGGNGNGRVKGVRTGRTPWAELEDPIGNGIEGVTERDFSEGDRGGGNGEGNEHREADGDERGDHDLVSPTSDGDDEERRRRTRDQNGNGNGNPHIMVSRPDSDSEGISSPSEEGGTL